MGLSSSGGHADAEESPETDKSVSIRRAGKRKKEAAHPVWQLTEFMKRSLHKRHVLGSSKTECVVCCLADTKQLHRVKGETGTGASMGMLPGTGNYLLGQVTTTICSSHQCAVRDTGQGCSCVSQENIHFHQTAPRAAVGQICPSGSGPAHRSGLHHGTVSPLCSFYRPDNCCPEKPSNLPKVTQLVSHRNVILTQACLVSKPIDWLRVGAVFLESPGPLLSQCFLGSHSFLHPRGTGPTTYTPCFFLIYQFCFDENSHPPPPVHSCC